MMKSLGINEIRKHWVLYALLDCDQWSEDDIHKLFYLMAETNYIEIKSHIKDDTRNHSIIVGSRTYKNMEELNKDFKPKTFTKFKESMNINPIFRKEFKKILKTDPISRRFGKTGASSAVNTYTLDEDYTVLYQVLKEFKSIQNSDFQRAMLNGFLGSEYAERLINEDLINEIILKLGLFLNKKENEDKFLMFLLRNSPTVLYETLKKFHSNTKNHSKEIKIAIINDVMVPFNEQLDPKMITREFLKDVKIWAYSDIQEDIHISPFKVDYEVSMAIIPDEEKPPIKHASLYTLEDLEVERLIKEFGEAYKEGVLKAVNEFNLDIPTDYRFFNIRRPYKMRSITNKQMESFKIKYKEMGYNRMASTAHLIKTVHDEMNDENMFIKQNGKKIEEKIWILPPPTNIAPFVIKN